TAPATTHIHPLSLHDALPISGAAPPIPSSDEKLQAKPEPSVHELHLLLEEMEDERSKARWREAIWISVVLHLLVIISILLGPKRSEEHTSELQSLAYLVCRLL